MASESFGRIRQTVAVLRASGERVESRLAELKVANQRLQACLKEAEAQTESAEAMISFQAARADAAEQRSRDIETKFVQVLNDLADELELTGFEGVNSAQTDSDHSLKLRKEAPERWSARRPVSHPHAIRRCTGA
jgi:chromosome segregation ATPase